MAASDPAVPGLALPPDAVAPVRAAGVPAPGSALHPHHRWCFGCGSEQGNGVQLAAIAGEGVSVTATAMLTAAHQGAPGLAHGGIVAAAMDDSLGFLPPMMLVPAVTAKLDLTYRRPIPIGRELHIVAWCTGVAGRKVYTYGEARLDTSNGPLVADAAGLFIAVKPQHFQAFAGAGEWAYLAAGAAGRTA